MKLSEDRLQHQQVLLNMTNAVTAAASQLDGAHVTIQNITTSNVNINNHITNNPDYQLEWAHSNDTLSVIPLSLRGMGGSAFLTLLPLLTRGKFQTFNYLGSVFAAGIILATAFVHILPDAGASQIQQLIILPASAVGVCLRLCRCCHGQSMLGFLHQLPLGSCPCWGVSHLAAVCGEHCQATNAQVESACGV